MILLAHMILGALIGQKILNPFLAVILAFLSHYLLDIFPHIEYSIDNIKSKNWNKSIPDLLKVFFDFLAGIIIIFSVSDNQPVVYVATFFAIFPDGLSILGSVLKNTFLKHHSWFHQEKLHFLKNKKISIVWRILTQAFVIFVCIYLFNA